MGNILYYHRLKHYQNKLFSRRTRTCCTLSSLWTSKLSKTWKYTWISNFMTQFKSIEMCSFCFICTSSLVSKGWSCLSTILYTMSLNSLSRSWLTNTKWKVQKRKKAMLFLNLSDLILFFYYLILLFIYTDLNYSLSIMCTMVKFKYLILDRLPNYAAWLFMTYRFVVFLEYFCIIFHIVFKLFFSRRFSKDICFFSNKKCWINEKSTILCS